MRRLAAVLAALAAVAAVAVPASASAAAPTSSAGQPMLVFLRTAALPSGVGRTEAMRAQADVAALASDLGSRVLARTTVPDTLTVDLDGAEASALRHDPQVAAVLPDATIPGPVEPAPLLASGSPARGPATPHAPCGTPAHPELDPEGLAAIDDVNGANRGFVGKGVLVAFLADGLDPSNPDLRRNAAYASASSPKGSRVIETYADFSGDGTAAATDGAEAFGDAGSIAAQGNAVYDLSRYVSAAHPLPHGCDARVVGTAPGATLLALKIFGEGDDTTGSGFVQAIDDAVESGAKVINESFGSNPFPDTAADIVRAADEAAYDAGVTVVVSSGDAGPSGTIGSPATDPDVLAVGATTTFRAYAQDTYGGINAPGQWSGGYLDDNISALSSGGVAQDGKTVDLVAPGDLGWSLCSANQSMYTGCDGESLQLFGGTSEAAPLTSGAAADVISAYEASHGGTAPSPALVMQILTSSAKDVAAPADEQGAGLLDVGAAVRLALSTAGTTDAAHPGGVLVGATQEDLQGDPGAQVSADVDVTNTSATPMHVTLSTRTLQPAGTIGGELVLDPSSSRTPTFRIWSGVKEIYRLVRFKVPAGIGRLEFRAAYRYDQQASLLHVALFDPHHRYAAYTLPQGIGDYGDAEVADPAAGEWTAVFFTLKDGTSLGDGTSGPVPFSVQLFRFVPLGTVGPGALTLAAGQTESVEYHDVLGSTPGDATASIVVTTPLGRTTVPVVLRTMAAFTGDEATFVGVLLGGNGRGGAPGQTDTYAFDVPAGQNDLEAAVRLSALPAAGDIPGEQLTAQLVDPYGQAVAMDTNYSDTDVAVVIDRTVELYVADPAEGTWELVLDWTQPGAGTTTSIPYRVTLGLDQVSVSASLPDSASTDVPTSGETLDVTVHDTGIAPILVSPDARGSGEAVVDLPDLLGHPATQTLPGASNTYYVPPGSTSLTITETASSEVTFDADPYSGDPDLSPQVTTPYTEGSTTATQATLTYAPPDEVAPGMWGVAQDEFGPYASAEAPVDETTQASVMTAPFDPSISSPVPDTVEALAIGGELNPEVVDPGQDAVIPITIAPTASPGTVVSGTLYIDGFMPGSYFGTTLLETPAFTSVLAAIPYEYTVSP